MQKLDEREERLTAKHECLQYGGGRNAAQE